jgi:hypothetical protein
VAPPVVKEVGVRMTPFVGPSAVLGVETVSGAVTNDKAMSSTRKRVRWESFVVA